MWPAWRFFLFAALTILGSPSLAYAGMPSITLTDVARLRIQGISFFAMGLLISAFVIQRLWNYLQRDFHRLPRLTYGKALGVVFLWGLLFVLVLTMISGARELMTPGAWEKHGLTYRLADQPGAAEPENPSEDPRHKKLEALRHAIWNYALAHPGNLPRDRAALGLTNEEWLVPDPSRMTYLYIGGLKPGKGETPLVFEPEIFGSKRLVLLANGQINEMENEALVRALPPEKP